MTAPAVRSIFLAVAPNGARKTKADHLRLPITPGELADCAAACRDAGACMVHLHVRDELGRHSLDIGAYRDAIGAIRRAVGDSLVIQVTTEAVGIYRPAEQMAVIRGLRPEAVSMAIRELFSDDSAEAEAAAFLTWAHDVSVAIQFILYDSRDVQKYLDLRSRGIVRAGRHWVLFVLGRYGGGASSFEDLLPMYTVWSANAELTGSVAWAVCAFGQREIESAVASVALGGHARIGFENNLLLPDGRVARNNAELISSFADIARDLGYRTATAGELRDAFS